MTETRKTGTVARFHKPFLPVFNTGNHGLVEDVQVFETIQGVFNIRGMRDADLKVGFDQE